VVRVDVIVIIFKDLAKFVNRVILKAFCPADRRAASCRLDIAPLSMLTIVIMEVNK
jgi:hypothetical protein